MAQELKPIRLDPDSTPPSWEFQLIEDGVPGAFYRTMRPGEEANPTRITLPDPENPNISHDVILFRAAS
jgi:hypothetical protein